MRALILLVAAMALAGCATGVKLSPEQTHQLMVDFHNAGCGGRVDLDAGAATGQVGGEAHISLGLHGECPAGIPPPPAPPGVTTPSA